jgi:hypothetical protein
MSALAQSGRYIMRIAKGAIFFRFSDESPAWMLFPKSANDFRKIGSFASRDRFELRFDPSHPSQPVPALQGMLEGQGFCPHFRAVSRPLILQEHERRFFGVGKGLPMAPSLWSVKIDFRYSAGHLARDRFDWSGDSILTSCEDRTADANFDFP